MPSPVTLFQWLNDGGVIALLVVAVLAFLQRWVVPQSIVTEKDRQIASLEQQVAIYRELALRNAGSQQTQAQAVQDLADAVRVAIANAGAHP